MRRSLIAASLAILCAFPFWQAGAQESAAAAAIRTLQAKSTEPGFAGLALAASRSATAIEDAITILAALAPKASQADRRPLLVELACLYELAERWPEAARAWQEAASTLAGSPDHSASLSAAAAWLAAGQPDKAAALARATLSASSDRVLLDRATLLLGWSSLDSGDADAALAAAAGLIDSGRAGSRPGALLLAIRASDGTDRERYSSLLEKEFPGMGGSAQFALYGLSALQSTAPVWKPVDQAAGGTVPAPAPQGSSPATVSVAPAGTVQSSPLWYQVGAFRERQNAEIQAKAVAGKGFSVKVSEKASSTGPVFTVMVGAGKDPGATLMSLKDAGFEAWPVFDLP